MTEVTEILYQWSKGVSRRQIEKTIGTSRNTIKKIINQAVALGHAVGPIRDETLLTVSADITRWLQQKENPSVGPTQQQLAAVHEQIKTWFDEPYMTVTQVRRLLSELNPAIDASETSLHRYIKKHFPKPIHSTVVLHTLPGEQGQVDFGYAGLTFDLVTHKRKRTYAFVMTLSYSRHRFVCFVHKQDEATWIQCHVNAFKFFGGVPQSILLDNLKAGVIKPHIYDPVINRSYAECARYYGFVVDPAKVRTPTHKGKVERSIQIVRQQILAGRDFKDLHALNTYTLHWCQHVIANEVTRTTGETPLVRFERDEESKLITLPDIPYEYATWQTVKVGRDQHITFQGCFYSLPLEYTGKTLLLKSTDRLIVLYDQGKQIKMHQRLTQKGTWCTDDADIKDSAKYYMDNTPEICLAKAKELGPAIYTTLYQLLEKPSTSKRRKAQAILRLADKHSSSRVEEACAYALTFGNTTVEALKKIIIHDLDKKSNEMTDRMSFDELSEGAFLRHPHEFLTH